VKALPPILLMIVMALPARTAGAQEPVDVRLSEATGDFPNGIEFRLEAAGAGIDDVRLVYEIAPDGVRATAVPECTGGAVISCRFLLAATRQNPIIPGAQVTYSWRLTAGGRTQDTPEQAIAYEDTRFDWSSLSEGNVTLFWYSGSEDDARAVLSASNESMERMGALLGTSVDFPVKVYYYGSAQDMQQAIIADEREGVVTLGEVVYSDTAMVAADASPLEIARHEVAHIVIRQAAGDSFSIPDWLNEGTAVYAQSQPLPGQRQAIEQAIASGQVFSVRSLSSASAGALSERVFLFYGQSWSIVNFLVDEYGEERFAELFRAFADGASTAEALDQVYGFNQDGLENAWRASVGLAPRTAPTPDDERAPVATDGRSGDGAERAGEDGNTPVLLIGVIIALTVLLAGGLIGGGVLLARRYR
jgi:hypothetical protein